MKKEEGRRKEEEERRRQCLIHLQTLEDESYLFIPGSWKIEGLVICWKPEEAYLISLKENTYQGVTGISLQARWEAIKRVRGKEKEKKD